MKNENIVKLAVVIVVIAITAGVIGFMFAKNTQTPAQQTGTSQSAASVAQPLKNNVATVKNNLLQDKNASVGGEILMNLPNGWGDLVVPNLDGNSLVLNSPYGTKEKTVLFSPGQASDAKMISDYNYGDRSQYNVAPYVVINTYPAKFSDDDPSDANFVRLYTAKEKEVNFQPIVDVFNQRSVDKLNLSQKYFSKSSAEKDKIMQSAYRSFWWANEFAAYDRVNVRYFENAAANLRGIGYFEISGQETPDTISGYKVVLFNPEKRMTVEIFLPLEGIYNFGLTNIPYNEKISAKKMDEIYVAESARLVQKAYAYLENPENYKDQKLGQFLREVEAMVSSIKLVR